MNKIMIAFMVVALSILVGGCKDKEVQVQITRPEDGFTLNGLTFTINGVIHNSSAAYFFYQVEDGHSFIGDGIVTPDENGHFEAEIVLANPSNPQGQLVFYLDENGNGQFDQETDTSTAIGGLSLVFDDSIVIWHVDKQEAKLPSPSPAPTQQIDAVEESPPPPFQAHLLNQQPLPYWHILPSGVEEYVQQEWIGESRFGQLVLESAGEAFRQSDKNRTRYSGDFNIVHVDSSGNRNEIMLLTDIQLLEDINPWQWMVIPLDGADLFILQPDQSEYYKHSQSQRNVRMIAVTESDAVAVSFHMDADGSILDWDELTIYGDQPIEYGEDGLTLYSAVPSMHKLTLAFDLEQGYARIVGIDNQQQWYQEMMELVEEQSRILEKFLLYGVGDWYYGVEMDEELRSSMEYLLSDEALQSESFQYMQEHRLRFERAFYTGASDVRLDEEAGRLSFTFALNIFYAIGQDLRLQVCMVREGDTWKFHNFGSLHYERYDDDSHYL